MTRTPRLETVVDTVVENRLAAVHTCMPGRVVSFDGDRNAISVQPLLRDSYIDDDGVNQSESLPVISDVPVVYPRGGGGSFSIMFPLGAGDLVTLIFSEKSMDRWLSGDGSEVTPADLRKHQLSDAYAVPGGYPFQEAVSPVGDKVVFTYGSTSIHISDSLIELGAEGSGDKVPLDSKVQQELNALRSALDALTNVVTTNATLYSAHSHAVPAAGLQDINMQPITGTATASPPTTPATPGVNPPTINPTNSNLVTIRE